MMMKKILFAFLFVLTATAAAFSATSVSNLMSQIDNNLSRFPDISQSAYEKISEFVNESLTKDPNATFKTASYYSDPRTKQEYTVNLSFPTLASANADKIATECAKIDRIVCPNSETDGCAVGHFTQPSGCLIYILRSPAETHRSISTEVVTLECSETTRALNCSYPSSIPQSQIKDYTSVTGTIYMPGNGFERFEHRVKIEFISSDGKVKQTYFATPQSPHFGFGVPTNEDGKVVFTIVRDTPEVDIYDDPLPVSISDYRNGKANGVIRVRQKAPSRNTGSSASAGGTATTATNSGTPAQTPSAKTMQFDATLVYQDASGNYIPISGATVTDTSKPTTTTTTGSDGKFTIECILTRNSRCNLKFGANGQPDYRTSVSSIDIGKRISYTGYQITTPTQSENYITAKGKVFDANTKEPIAGALIFVTKDEQFSTTTDATGTFSFTFDTNRGEDVTISMYSYNNQTVRATRDMTIYLVPENITLDEVPVSGTDYCNQPETRKKLYASATKWFETDEDMPNQDHIYVTAKKQVCIPTACISGYTLEKENTADAFCKQCKKEDIQFARKVKVRENKCILDGDNACESGYAPNSDFTQCVEICNDDAKRNLEGANEYKVKNGQCVAASCKCGYTLDDGTCKKWAKDEKCTRNETPKLPNDATEAFKRCDSDGTPYCEITENGCKPGYKPSDDKRTCIQQTGKDCTEEIKNDNPLVTKAKWELRNNELVCAIIGCTDGFDVDKVNNKCIPEDQTGKPCPDNLKPDNAKRAIVSEQEVTEASKCEVKSCNDGYIPAKENANDTYFTKCIPDCGCLERFNESQTACESLEDLSCTITNAKEAQLVCENGKEVCKIMNDSCEEGFRANTTNTKCESLKNENCEIEKTDTNNADQIKTAKYELRNGKMVCVITSCNDLYKPSVDGQSCVNTQCECGQEWDKRSRSCVPWKKQTCTMKHATKTNRICEDGNEVCKIIECDTAAGYVLNQTNNSCDSIKNDPCSDDQIRAVEHAVAGKQQVQNGKIVCVVTDCGNLHTPSADGSSCRPKPMLTEQQHREKIGALSENAQKMRENETSLKNRIIGAAGIGVTGIGGAMVGDALSSRAAELSAEQDMAAYLQSMYCEYGDGKTIRGGETGVELPGGNDMIDLYTQYAQLANDLKIRKDALGIRPGIESEVVIDKAETGLYDDVGTGITGGTYASIARAMLYPDGPDAAKWAQMRAATDNKLKAGAIVAGVGAVGSGVANLIANRDPKDNTDEIVRKYEALKKPFEALEQKLPNRTTDRTCPSGSFGSYPNCKCTNSAYFQVEENKCVECSGDLVPNAKGDGCECQDGKVQEGTTCKTPSTNCSIKHLKQPNTCQCIESAEIKSGDTDCTCKRGYTEKNDGSGCERSAVILSIPQMYPTKKIVDIKLGADTTFASGKAELTTAAKNKLWDFSQSAKNAVKENKTNIDLQKENDYCIIVVGKTDHQQFANPDNNMNNNQSLSQRRAEAVKTQLGLTFNPNNIMAYGIADTDCTPDTPLNNVNCRVVQITLVAGSCNDNLNAPQKLVSTLTQTQAGADILNAAILNTKK